MSCIVHGCLAREKVQSAPMYEDSVAIYLSLSLFSSIVREITRKRDQRKLETDINNTINCSNSGTARTGMSQSRRAESKSRERANFVSFQPTFTYIKCIRSSSTIAPQRIQLRPMTTPALAVTHNKPSFSSCFPINHACTTPTRDLPSSVDIFACLLSRCKDIKRDEGWMGRTHQTAISFALKHSSSHSSTQATYEANKQRRCLSQRSPPMLSFSTWCVTYADYGHLNYTNSVFADIGRHPN